LLYFSDKKQALIDCEPEIHRLSDNAELSRQYDAFRSSRDEFMRRIRSGETDTIKQV